MRVALVITIVVSAAGCKGRSSAKAALDARAPAVVAVDAAAAVAPVDAGIAAVVVDAATAAAIPSTCLPVAAARGKVELSALGNSEYLLGIDVSHYQGHVDWPAVAAAGVHFAYVKATDGLRVDPCFERNWRGAKAAGVRRGAYHYFHPSDGALEQAKHFVRVVPAPEADDLPPAFDLEHSKDFDEVTVKAAIADAQVWLAHVRTAVKRRPIIYSSARIFRDYLHQTRVFDGYQFWLADYKAADRASGAPRLTPGETTWTLWQLSGDVTVPGVAGLVDASWFAGRDAELAAFVEGSRVR